jgi:hypothetical protein
MIKYILLILLLIILVTGCTIINNNHYNTNLDNTINVPETINSLGNSGQLTYTSNYLYICVSSNTWKRCIIGGW